MWELIYLWSFKYLFMPDYLSGNSVEADLADVERWMKKRIEVQREDQPWMFVGIHKVLTSLVLPMYTTVDAQLTTGRLGWKYCIKIQYYIIHDEKDFLLINIFLFWTNMISMEHKKIAQI